MGGAAPPTFTHPIRITRVAIGCYKGSPLGYPKSLDKEIPCALCLASRVLPRFLALTYVKCIQVLTILCSSSQGCAIVTNKAVLQWFQKVDRCSQVRFHVPKVFVSSYSVCLVDLFFSRFQSNSCELFQAIIDANAWAVVHGLCKLGLAPSGLPTHQ